MGDTPTNLQIARDALPDILAASNITLSPEALARTNELLTRNVGEFNNSFTQGGLFGSVFGMLQRVFHMLFGLGDGETIQQSADSSGTAATDAVNRQGLGRFQFELRQAARLDPARYGELARVADVLPTALLLRMREQQDIPADYQPRWGGSMNRRDYEEGQQQQAGESGQLTPPPPVPGATPDRATGAART